MEDIIYPHFPGRPLIEAYGDGGFRFADMSHKGSLLIIDSGTYAWSVTTFTDITEQDMALLFNEVSRIELIIFGTGNVFLPAPMWLTDACRSLSMSFECMSTDAAVRTYNILRRENRRVAAAMIAMDNRIS